MSDKPIDAETLGRGCWNIIVWMVIGAGLMLNFLYWFNWLDI